MRLKILCPHGKFFHIFLYYTHSQFLNHLMQISSFSLFADRQKSPDGSKFAENLKNNLHISVKIWDLKTMLPLKTGNWIWWNDRLYRNKHISKKYIYTHLSMQRSLGRRHQWSGNFSITLKDWNVMNNSSWANRTQGIKGDLAMQNQVRS